MNIKPSISLAAGLCLGGLIAAPAAAQVSIAGTLLLQQGVDGIQDNRSSGDQFGTVLAWGDFDGDGFEDLAIGVPDEDFFFEDDGIVQVLYGGAAGLTGDGDQRFFRALIPDAGTTHPGDRLGHALAAGDFDGNGFADLAIGIPGDEVNGRILAGSVVVLRGSPTGLLTGAAQLWHQDAGGMPEVAEVGDSFGSALAAGDFDDDGFADLAVGAPFEAFGAELAAGVVHVLQGSVSGLEFGTSLLMNRGHFEELSPPTLDDVFGAALAAGDLDGDGHDDLAIGVPGADLNSVDAAGRVLLGLGSATGLHPASPLIVSLFRADTNCRQPGTSESAEPGDRFGSTLAMGDFDGDGDDDLAVGIPGATVGGDDGAGQVNVTYTFLPGETPGDCWNQGVPGVGGGLVFSDERFGAALAAGDLTGGGVADLVVGVPGERLALGAIGFGGFHVFHGGPGGLGPAAKPFWTQSTIGLANGIETGDAFAFALALGDSNGDGHADLAVGVPGEEIDSSEPNHGAIHVLYNGPRIFADGFELGDTTAWSSTAPVVSPLARGDLSAWRSSTK